tara:strand:+ start:437 stop:577 length:141 start_codon:yes stop_codon:yes gene_type:complete
MSQKTLVIIACSVLIFAICMSCYVIISAHRQIKKYVVEPIEGEYPE